MSENKELKDSIKGGISLIDHILKYKGFRELVGVSTISKTQALEDAKKHLNDHLITLNIRAKTVDSYKLISWYGFFLSNIADDPKKIIRIATIIALNILLKKEVGKSIPRELLSEMAGMAIRDGLDDNFGIGKNGVYSSFKSCSKLQ